MKLIPKDALVAEIERLKEQDYPCDTFEESTGYYNALDEIATFLDTLEVKEVDLEKEIVDRWKTIHNAGNEIPFDTFNGIAKHFFELGLKASSNISIEVTSIDEELKENGIDPNSKEAKIIKESYYTAIEKLSAQKGE